MNAVSAAVAAALAQGSGPVVVGFSGGLDSTVLLHAVAGVRRRDVVAVHVDHGIDPASADWCARCARTAQRLGLDFFARRVDVAPGSGLEARARSARYAVFRELLASRGSRLLLAQHRDDQVETGLLRLVQGRGLYGMPESRPLAAGTVLRPLLELPRSLLRDYARDHRLDWIEDPGNLDLGLDRNRLRHRLLPALRAHWPGVDAALLDAMQAGRDADRRAAAALDASIEATRLPISLLDGDPGMTRLRLWLQQHGVALPRRAAREEFLRQIRQAGSDRRPRLTLGEGLALERHDHWVYLRSPAPALAECYPLEAPGLLQLPHGDLWAEAAPCGVRPAAPLSVRFRRGGERLRCDGRERTVKQLLRDARLPPWVRAGYPLVYDAGGLLALPGLAERDSVPGGAPGEGACFRLRWSPR